MAFFSNLATSLKTYKAQIIAFGVLLITIAVMSLYILDVNRQNKAITEERNTLNVQFQQIGKAYQAQGEAFKTDKAAAAAAQDALGKKMADAMAKHDASLRALFTAVGEVKSEVESSKPTTVTPGVGGSFKDTILVQGRTGPSLTEVILNYDPSNSSPTKRLTGSWLNYKEDFFPVVGEWQAKDGGYTGTMRLTRKVYRPDGVGGFKEIGSEEVPLTNATATFGPVAFGGSQALAPVPRLTLFGGIGRDTAEKKEVPVLGMDYRWTTNMGTGIGIAGNIVFGTLSLRIGK